MIDKNAIGKRMHDLSSLSMQIVLEFPTVFWDNSLSYFGAALPGGAEKRGAACIFWNLHPLTGCNQLTALVSGSSAYAGETASVSELTDMALKVLRVLFGDKVPELVGATVTRWMSEKYSRGKKTLFRARFRSSDLRVMGPPLYH